MEMKLSKKKLKKARKQAIQISWGKGIRGKETASGQGPNIGVCLVCPGKREAVSMAVAQ